MISKECFKKNLMKLRVAFPNWKLDLTNADETKIFYELLNEYFDKDDDFSNATLDFIRNENFPPTISKLLEYKPKKKIKSEFMGEFNNEK